MGEAGHVDVEPVTVEPADQFKNLALRPACVELCDEHANRDTIRTHVVGGAKCLPYQTAMAQTVLRPVCAVAGMPC